MRLPAPKALPPELARRLKQKVGSEVDLKVAPQMTEYGWYCACGAFHPIEENCVWCSECGSDRILMQNALSTLLQQGHTAEEPTRMVTSIKDESPTRVVTDLTEQDRAAITGRVEEDDGDMRIAQPGRRTTATLPPEEFYGEEEEAQELPEDPDETARKIIRWAPPITVVVCAIIALVGYLWVKLFVK